MQGGSLFVLQGETTIATAAKLAAIETRLSVSQKNSEELDRDSFP
jgi:hypothetical protein